MLSPRPVPLPGPFEVKNGSNTLSSIAGGNAAAGVADGDQRIVAGPNVAVGAGVVFVEIGRAGLQDQLAAIRASRRARSAPD